jgi:hypothetical protein
MNNYFGCLKAFIMLWAILEIVVVPSILISRSKGVDSLDEGIASQFAFDIGIENHPDFIFRENFEEASIDDMLARWESIKNREKISFSFDIPKQSGGIKSILMNGVADMYRRILPGYEQVYVRFYAKFDTGCKKVHHWVWLGGHNPSTPWPWPRAGTKPNGDERWSTGIEPMGSNWAWDFYTYWMNMRTNPDTRFWGNTFNGRPSPFPVAKGEWICIEFMVKMNEPPSSFNGEQAFWINGVKLSHLGQGFPKGKWVWDGFYPDSTGEPFEGFQWRKVPELNINYFWLENYVDTDTNCKCWFDDIVLAKSYIGPIAKPRLSLFGTSADHTIHLAWTLNTTLQPSATWEIAYEGPAGDQPSPITGIPYMTRSYTLTGLTNDVWYSIILKAIDSNIPILSDTVRIMPHGISSVDNNNPFFTGFLLKQNVPNPFSDLTIIQFAIHHREHITLKIYDVLGREVATLVDGEMEAGEHSVVFDASNLPSGVYFYRLQAGNFVEQKKMVVVK